MFFHVLWDLLKVFSFSRWESYLGKNTPWRNQACNLKVVQNTGKQPLHMTSRRMTWSPLLGPSQLWLGMHSPHRETYRNFVEMGPILINDQHGSTFQFNSSALLLNIFCFSLRFRMLFQLARQLGTNWAAWNTTESKCFHVLPVISAQSYKMLQIIIVLPSRLNALTNINKFSNVLVSDSETFTQSAIVGTVDIDCWFSTNDRYTPQDGQEKTV